MNTVAGPFLLLAGLGFLLSLTAHVLALLGKPCPGGGLVWLLHLGVFVVWVPTIILSRRRLRGVSQTKQMEALWADCPAWMRWAIRIVFVYAIEFPLVHGNHDRYSQTETEGDTAASGDQGILRPLDGFLWRCLCYALFASPKFRSGGEALKIGPPQHFLNTFHTILNLRP